MCRRILRSSYGWRTQRYWDRRMANVQKDIKIIVWLMHRRILIMIIKYRIWEISSLLWYHRSLTCVSCVYFYWHVSIVLWNEQQERGVLRSSYSWCTEGYWDRHMVDIQKHIEIVTWLICKRILRLSYGWCTEEYWDRHMAYVEKNIEIVIRLVYRRILRSSSYSWCTEEYWDRHTAGVQRNTEIVIQLVYRRILRSSYGWCTEEYWDRHTAGLQMRITDIIPAADVRFSISHLTIQWLTGTVSCQICSMQTGARSFRRTDWRLHVSTNAPYSGLGLLV